MTHAFLHSITPYLCGIAFTIVLAANIYVSYQERKKNKRRKEYDIWLESEATRNLAINKMVQEDLCSAFNRFKGLTNGKH